VFNSFQNSFIDAVFSQLKHEEKMVGAGLKNEINS
jgi:hypothetical protein